MRKSSVRLARLAVGGIPLLAAGSMAAALPARAATLSLARLAGGNQNSFASDRYGTAAAIAVTTFPNGAATVLLATGTNFPDALAGAYLAGNENNGAGAPILLTNADSIPADTITALTTLKARNVVILGGTSAVSSAVETDLVGIPSSASGGGKLTVTRIAGATDRYDTMKAVDTQAGNVAGKDSAGDKTAILATGTNFPDALGAGPIAYADHFPLVLTDGTATSLSSQALDVLKADAITHVIVVGGTSAINQAQLTQLTGMSITVDQQGGQTRSQTSQKLAEDAIAHYGLVTTHMNVANGFDLQATAASNLPLGFSSDALAGAPHGGSERAPTLITNSPTDPGFAAVYSGAHLSTLTGGHVFGGTTAVSDAALSAIQTGTTTSGSGGTAPVTATSLPQLVGAKAGTTTASGTTMEYDLSKAVTQADPKAFKLYLADGSSSSVGSSANVASGGTAVAVLFSGVNATTGTGAANIANYQLASVASGAVHTSGGATNPDGAVVLGTAHSVLPELTAVALVPVTGLLGTSESVTYTFSQSVSASLGSLGGFHLYLADGTELTAPTCTAGGNPASISCTGFNLGSTLAPLSPATSSQVASAVLGTVDAAAVSGTGSGGASLANPEGAANTTGGTGTAGG